MKKNINEDIILYDLEVAYTTSATWGLYDQNVAKVIREPYIISYAWKYLGEKTTHVIALPDFKGYPKDRFNDRELVKSLYDLFDKAKIVIAHNNNAFDYKWVYGRFAVHKILPPSPCQMIDTLLIARSKFKFNSHKLSDLGKYFKLGDKVNTGGIDLWYNCIELNDKKAWNLMRKYNKQDVILLEKVYLHILPFITNHPNLALMEGETTACPNCKSKNVKKCKLRPSRTGWKQQWQCYNCGSYHTSPKKEGSQIR